MFIDSHCHLDQLDLSEYQGDLDLAIQAATRNKVSHLLCVCIELKDFPQVLAIAQRYEHIFASVGVHPNSEEQEPTIEQLCRLAQDPKIVAIGETGLDYYRSQGDLTWQRQRFICHIETAKQVKKPLIVHTRAAAEDTIKLLRENDADQVGGVMHCFTESWDIASAALDLGFYISFAGIITFKNATVIQEVATKVPLDRILIETDSPYLAPIPYRGKPNQPAYVPLVAQKIAELRGESLEDIAAQTSANFHRLFLS